MSRFPSEEQGQFVSPGFVASIEQGSRDRHPLRGRVLLVDDDDDLRKLLRALLEGDGYQVFACRDAARALKIFTSRGDIDLLLTDFHMPQMSGFELSERVAELQPQLPILILSGAVLPEDLRARMAAHRWEFIAKPCEVPVLLHMIASRLESAAVSWPAKTEACAP